MDGLLMNRRSPRRAESGRYGAAQSMPGGKGTFSDGETSLIRANWARSGGTHDTATEEAQKIFIDATCTIHTGQMHAVWRHRERRAAVYRCDVHNSHSPEPGRNGSSPAYAGRTDYFSASEEAQKIFIDVTYTVHTGQMRAVWRHWERHDAYFIDAAGAIHAARNRAATGLV